MRVNSIFGRFNFGEIDTIRFSIWFDFFGWVKIGQNRLKIAVFGRFWTILDDFLLFGGKLSVIFWTIFPPIPKNCLNDVNNMIAHPYCHCSSQQKLPHILQDLIGNLLDRAGRSYCLHNYLGNFLGFEKKLSKKLLTVFFLPKKSSKKYLMIFSHQNKSSKKLLKIFPKILQFFPRLFISPIFGCICSDLREEMYISSQNS